MSLSEIPFDFALKTRLVYGAGAAGRAGEFARELGGARVLLVTDPGVESAGHTGPVIEALQSTRFEVRVFNQVIENPSTHTVEECAACAREEKIDLLVGLGGGSSLDTAKGCNFLLTNGGRMEDYRGWGKAAKPMLPMIAVPTTAGTGSECQSYALISEDGSHCKMACGDAKAAPRVALLDPSLTLTQPQPVMAHTAMDAVSHALESSVTLRRNLFSWMFARESFRLAQHALPLILENPRDLFARGEMLLAAALAGLAIEHSMLGAAHAAANPLTAHHGVVHGQAVAVMLPAVIRFNAGRSETRQLYHELAVTSALAQPGDCEEKAVQLLHERVQHLLDRLGMARSLRALNVPQEDLPNLAREAAEQWTGKFNPRPVSVEDFLQLYEEVY